MKFVGAVATIILALGAALGQGSDGFAIKGQFTGKVKAISYYRTYLIRNYVHVDPSKQLIAREMYDAAGQLVQSSEFGTAEERTSYRSINGQATKLVEYFDLAGNPQPTLASTFSAAAALYSQNDLCPKFILRAEQGPGARTNLTREVCEDGSTRAWETNYFDEHHVFITYHREDEKGRSWETTETYDAAGKNTGFSYTANTLIKPKYTQVITYVDEKLDDRRNWIQVVATVSGIARPKEIAAQFVDERQLTYFP